MWLLRLSGMGLLGLGAIGLVLPVWPTTIFWILAAMCFARSHPPTRDWIYARPGFGKVIEDFTEHGVMNRRSKLAALGGMVLAGGIICLALWRHWWGLTAGLGLLICDMLYVVSRKEE